MGNNENIKKTLSDLLGHFNDGMYSENEAISNCMDFIIDANDRKALWVELPNWIKDEIKARLNGFNESDEIVTFGNGDPAVTKSRLLELKKWMQQESSI